MGGKSSGPHTPRRHGPDRDPDGTGDRDRDRDRGGTQVRKKKKAGQNICGSASGGKVMEKEMV